MKSTKTLKIFSKALGLICLSFLIYSCLSTKDSAVLPEAPATTFNSCNYTPAPKGSRKLGMDILSETTAKNYASNLATLQSLHGEYQTLHLTWSQLESAGSGTTSGSFSDPSNALDAFNTIANNNGIKLALSIRPIDATGKTVPSDLANTRFNNAALQTRFKNLINFVLTKISKNNLVVLIIGNEIDGYNIGSDSTFWSDYANFLYEMKIHIANNHVGLKMGTTVTHAALTESTKVLSGGASSQTIFSSYFPHIASGTAVVDVVGVTYYPLTNSLTMKDPSVVAEDFNHLVAFTDLPIYIQEIGYASSTASNGSDYKQAQFFCEVMKAWDDHASAIPRMAILRINDITRSEAETMAGPYGTSTESFIEYLRSLGIFTNAGSQKNSYTIISEELIKRNF